MNDYNNNNNNNIYCKMNIESIIMFKPILKDQQGCDDVRMICCSAWGLDHRYQGWV